MKRFFAAAVAAAVIFTACSGAGITGEGFRGEWARGDGFRLRTVTTVPGPADTAFPREITLAVDTSVDETYLAAAERFCETANSLSKSGITFTVEKSSSPVLDLRTGKAGLALAGGEATGALHPLFDIVNERFRYANYEEFSIVCNSEEVLSALSDACGLRVAAAYYTGSNVLVSYAPLDKLIGGGRASNQEASGPVAVVCGIPGSGTADILSPFCLSASEAAPLLERIVSLAQTNAIAEFTPDELMRTGFAADTPASSAIAAAAIAVGGEIPEDVEYPDNLVFTRTSHSITPAWLVFAPSFYESLPPAVRAALDEAAAGMCRDIDRFYLDRERDVFELLLYESGGTPQDGFALTRSRIIRATDEKRGEASAAERRLLDALDRLR